MRYIIPTFTEVNIYVEVVTRIFIWIRRSCLLFLFTNGRGIYCRYVFTLVRDNNLLYVWLRYLPFLTLAIKQWRWKTQGFCQTRYRPVDPGAHLGGIVNRHVGGIAVSFHISLQITLFQTVPSSVQWYHLFPPNHQVTSRDINCDATLHVANDT